jgi:hypothetical protein
LKSRWVKSKKNDMSWIASGLHAGVGVIAVDVEAVAVVLVGTRVNGSVVTGGVLGVSTSSVVRLWGTALNLPDTRATGVMGSDGILHSVQTVSKQNSRSVIRKKNLLVARQMADRTWLNIRLDTITSGVPNQSKITHWGRTLNDNRR